jgi:tetratricopeptide (TPR) repeat protein
MSTSAVTQKSRLQGLSQPALRSVVAAAQLLDQGRVAEADRQLIGALALHPRHPEVLRLSAGIQSLRGQHAEAVATMRSAVAQQPDDPVYLNTLGTALISQGDLDAAVSTLKRAAEIDPDLVPAWYNLGLALMHSVRPAEAAEALRRALALAPDHAAARVLLADTLRASGHAQQAAEEYRRVLAMQPSAGVAWWGLANLKSVRFESGDIDAMRRAMQRQGLGDDDYIAIGFALAKALDDAGEYASSLAALADANARARRRGVWNATAFSAQVDKLLHAFTPPPASSSSPLGAEVIFIVSMPRSGSTLIEQILASHSQVEGTSELPDLPLVLTEESQRRGKPFPTWIDAMQPADWERLGRRYLERTSRWREQRPRFTDKLLNNWFYLGAIRAMLPAARIVASRRDPLETCFSCYRQRFSGNEFTRTFADLAAYWSDFDRAIKHWRELHPQHVYENSYENLVTQPESSIRALLKFCDLEFEPACLEFHRTERDVLTASAAQVRAPLRSDTARAGDYGPLLDPLRAALGMPPFAK